MRINCYWPDCGRPATDRLMPANLAARFPVLDVCANCEPRTQELFFAAEIQSVRVFLEPEQGGDE